jgi:hypothetical protein
MRRSRSIREATRRSSLWLLPAGSTIARWSRGHSIGRPGTSLLGVRAFLIAMASALQISSAIIAAARGASWLFRILPVELAGNAGSRKILDGRLYGASR